MRNEEAKRQVLELLHQDIKEHDLDVDLSADPPGPDPAKFTLEGKPARVISPFDGFKLNINPGWFSGSDAMPEISGGPFYWYIFPVVGASNDTVESYYICDYHQMREWVLDFDAPLGNDHRDHHDWRAKSFDTEADQVKFVWGDETAEDLDESRIVQLNNLAQAIDSPRPTATTPTSTNGPSRPQQYLDFGPAPPDDPDELQQFARRVRRGQPHFRQALLKLYDERCAVTGHGPPEVLDAAHITSHADTGRNDPSNGLLLRADIHYLFDEGLLTIDPKTLVVSLDESLKNTPYWSLDGKRLRERKDGSKPTLDTSP